MARSIGAIVLGFVLIGALSFGTDYLMRNFIMPDAYAADGSTENMTILLITMVYVAVFAVAGCYLTGRLAPHHPLRHAMILGVLGLLFNIAGTVAMWNTAPPWFHLLNLAPVLPYAYLGGRLAESQAGHGSPAAATA